MLAFLQKNGDNNYVSGSTSWKTHGSTRILLIKSVHGRPVDARVMEIEKKNRNGLVVGIGRIVGDYKTQQWIIIITGHNIQIIITEKVRSGMITEKVRIGKVRSVWSVTLFSKVRYGHYSIHYSIKNYSILQQAPLSHIIDYSIHYSI
ncbi:hypothetical protein ACJX0J_028349, partial [Zea mays]